MILLQTQLLPDFVITQLAVIAHDQRHAIFHRQVRDGDPHLLPLLCLDDHPQRRQLRTGCLENRRVFDFHNHLPSTLPSP